MLDGARQVVRWTIPGGIFIIVFAAQIFVIMLVNRFLSTSFSNLFWDQIRLSADDVLGDWLAQSSLSLIAAIIIVAVPIGYLLYQLYYFTEEGPVIFWRRVPGDRGGDILRDLYRLNPRNVQLVAQALFWKPRAPVMSDSGLLVDRARVRRRRFEFSPLVLKKVSAVSDQDWSRSSHAEFGASRETQRPKKMRDVRYRYARSCDYNWHVVLTLVMLATGSSASGVAAQVRHLTDIYHSLGTSRVSGIVSTLSAVAVAGVIFNWSKWGALLLFVAVMAGGLAFFYVVLSTNRRSTRSRLINETSTALHIYLNTPPAVIQMPTGVPAAGKPANV